jgi:hypothetical protein
VKKMKDNQVDLFGEKRVLIPDNPKLANICSHILELYSRNPHLLDGKSIGEINRKVHLEIMLDNGLLPVIQSGNVDKFKEWYGDKKLNPDTEEECARALRFLVSKDYIRLPAEVIRESEQMRQHIERTLRK